MAEGITWIERCEVEIVGPVAHIVSHSGKDRFESRMLRSDLRRYVDMACNALDAAEKEECRLYEFRRSG